MGDAKDLVPSPTQALQAVQVAKGLAAMLRRQANEEIAVAEEEQAQFEQARARHVVSSSRCPTIDRGLMGTFCTDDTPSTELGRHGNTTLITSTNPESDKARWIVRLCHVLVPTPSAPPLLVAGFGSRHSTHVGLCPRNLQFQLAH